MNNRSVLKEEESIQNTVEHFDVNEIIQDLGINTAQTSASYCSWEVEGEKV